MRWKLFCIGRTGRRDALGELRIWGVVEELRQSLYIAASRRSESMGHMEGRWMLKMPVEHTGKVRDRQVKRLGTRTP